MQARGQPSHLAGLSTAGQQEPRDIDVLCDPHASSPKPKTPVLLLLHCTVLQAGNMWLFGWCIFACTALFWRLAHDFQVCGLMVDSFFTGPCRLFKQLAFLVFFPIRTGSLQADLQLEPPELFFGQQPQLSSSTLTGRPGFRIHPPPPIAAAASSSYRGADAAASASP